MLYHFLHRYLSVTMCTYTLIRIWVSLASNLITTLLPLPERQSAVWIWVVIPSEGTVLGSHKFRSSSITDMASHRCTRFSASRSCTIVPSMAWKQESNFIQHYTHTHTQFNIHGYMSRCHLHLPKFDISTTSVWDPLCIKTTCKLRPSQNRDSFTAIPKLHLQQWVVSQIMPPHNSTIGGDNPKIPLYTVIRLSYLKVIQECLGGTFQSREGYDESLELNLVCQLLPVLTGTFWI